MMEGPGQRIVELLERSVPASCGGSRIVARALATAGLDELPRAISELRDFVRRTLRSVLEEELGPSLAREVIHDVEIALAPALFRRDTAPAAPSSMRFRRVSPSPPSERRSILIVGGDRVANASIARALVQDQREVLCASDPSELAAANDRVVDAIVIDGRYAPACGDDVRDAALATAIDTLLTARPEVPVVVHNCTAGDRVSLPPSTRVTPLRPGLSTRDLVSAVAGAL